MQIRLRSRRRFIQLIGISSALVTLGDLGWKSELRTLAQTAANQLKNVNVQIQLQNIHCYDEADGSGSAEPYLWTVFFKIDGETTFIDIINGQATLQGTATVVSTPGNQGNLPNHDVDAGENISIPASLGEFNTVLKPIPFKGRTEGLVGGFVGCVVILLEEDNTPNSAIANGHQALNSAIQDGLNNLIPKLNANNQTPTNEDIEKIKAQVISAVKKAIKDNVSIWEWLGGLGNMDDLIGTDVFYYSQDEVVKAGSNGIPISRRWKNEGDWELKGRIISISEPQPLEQMRYDGIWVPANDGRPIVWGYTLQDFQAQNGKHYANGYKLMHQQSYDIGGGQRRYDGIWAPANDGRPIVWGYTLQDFQAQNGKHYANGYKLMHQQSYDIGGGQRRYDGIWAPANDGRPIVWGWTLKDFQAQNGKHYANGYKLMHQQSYDIGGGQRRYDGIWAPANDGRPIVWGYTLQDFQAQNGKHYANGYKLMHQQSYDIGGGQRRYDGIWALANDGRPIVWGWTLKDFQAKNNDLYGKGFRLMHQQGYEIG